VAGRLADRFGPRWLIAAGLGIVAASLYSFSGIAVDSSYLDLLPGFMLLGIGIALTMSPMTSAAMNAVAVEKAGIASGVLSMFRMVGGSLGAQALNEVVPQSLALVPEDQRPQVTHQSGANHLDSLQRNYAQAGVRAQALAFIDDMAEQYAAADLVICRAGALTVSELAAAGLPSILVPFPHAVDDHQTHNARFLADGGAAVLVQQRDLSARRLADLLLGFTRDKLVEMANRARALAKPGATASVAGVCMAIAA
jgi:UDP-N-acetylglucosamine--N-acetylmuramyl-(pentapeptide) pyrophosphoryl-undecaprenol N-acetylglucosamine transferase